MASYLPSLTGYEVRNGGFSDRPPAIRLHSLCPYRGGAFCQACPSEGHREYQQPALCRGYLHLRQPMRGEARSHRSSGYVLRPVSLVLWGSVLFFEPASGDFVIQPSIDSHDQSMASNCSQASNPFCQNRSKTPASRHSWKRR